MKNLKFIFVLDFVSVIALVGCQSKNLKLNLI